MTAPAQVKPVFDFGIGFKPFAERIAVERADRLARAPSVLSFGVPFLDFALGGIFANDLILLGALSGAGKTELGTLISEANVLQKKRVHYFALEAEEGEIERRIKYKRVVSAVLDTPGGMRQIGRLNYLDWYRGRLDGLTGGSEDILDGLLAREYSTLNTFYRVKDFTGEQMERTILAIQDQTDLIVLDHLHYIDTDDANENRAYKLIVKRLRDVALNIGKPVILVVHIRKADRKMKRLVPTIEDFHGTSDVPKIATKAIMLAPAFDQPQPTGTPWLWPTYIAPVKCRQDGQRARFTALVNFDARAAKYESDFVLGKLNIMGDKFEGIEWSKYPEWLKAALDPPKPTPYSREPGEEG